MPQSTSGLLTSQPEPVDLTSLNSFGCRATANELIRLTDDSPNALTQAARWLDRFDNGLILGGGSNLLFATDHVPAVLKIALLGRSCLADTAPADQIIVRAAAGESWHEFVLWSLDQGYAGLENLALIPGTVGAAPVQNIGAYGVELAGLIHAVEVFDRVRKKPDLLTASDCGFGYRDSEFKRQPNRWLITAVRFKLKQTPQLMLDYGELRDELSTQGVVRPTPKDVALAVATIRQRKLPDPNVLGNAGSFFKNPLVSTTRASQLSERWPDMPIFEMTAEIRKLAAGWLIEQCGLKGYRTGDAGIHESHALVLVNHGQASGHQLLALAQLVIERVQDRFGIELEPEPKIIQPA